MTVNSLTILGWLTALAFGITVIVQDKHRMRAVRSAFRQTRRGDTWHASYVALRALHNQTVDDLARVTVERDDALRALDLLAYSETYAAAVEPEPGRMHVVGGGAS